MEIRSKLPNAGTSIFAVMSKLAAEHNAINLSQGFPGFPVSSELIELVHKYQQLGFNQYSPMPGVPRLTEAIAKKIFTLYGKEYSSQTEITVTAGATQGLYTAISAYVHPGDEVIIFEPAYDSYAPAITVNGGIPKPSALCAPDFRINWEHVYSLLNSKTRVLIINSPHNPAGTIICEDDIRQLEVIAEKYDLIILSDEVYEHIVFDGKRHLSLVSSEILAPRTVLLCSFGKIYHTTGWKVGYVAAPEALTKEFRKLHQFTVFCVNTPVQHAYAEYMETPEHYLSLPNFFQKKRDFFLEKLAGSSFRFTPAEGTYFQLLDYSEISDLNEFDFAVKLTKETGVAVIPLSPFYVDGRSQSRVRICFAKEETMLAEAAEKLSKLGKYSF